LYKGAHVSWEQSAASSALRGGGGVFVTTGLDAQKNLLARKMKAALFYPSIMARMRRKKMVK
jgi:hypothetical protein